MLIVTRISLTQILAFQRCFFFLLRESSIDNLYDLIRPPKMYNFFRPFKTNDSLKISCWTLEKILTLVQFLFFGWWGMEGWWTLEEERATIGGQLCSPCSQHENCPVINSLVALSLSLCCCNSFLHTLSRLPLTNAAPLSTLTVLFSSLWVGVRERFWPTKKEEELKDSERGQQDYWSCSTSPCLSIIDFTQLDGYCNKWWPF